MCELREVSGKTVNFVWIGNNPVNALGAFNAASWLLCGWNVNVFRHVPPGGPQDGPTFAGGLDGQVGAAASAGNASFRTISLSEVARGDARKVMPGTAEVILPWLEAELRGNLPYVLGDISKAFIAGTQYGVVLDTKIGPSRWVHMYPSAPFQKFICASRLGGIEVENQCMGSFAVESSYAYAREYDPKPGNFLKGLDLEAVGQAESIFGGLTRMHIGTYSTLAKGRGAAALDITTHQVEWPKDFEPPRNLQTKAPYTFTELEVASSTIKFSDENALKQFIRVDGKARTQDNRAPFRVYQVQGYYNWRQGEYAQSKMSNDASVARTLVLDHVDNRGGKNLPDPFKSLKEEHYKIVGDMVETVVASLSTWREDKKQ